MNKKKKKVLVIDRNYVFKYMKSDVFDVMVVCLQEESKRRHIKDGFNVVACFEEEYEGLPVEDIPNNYLIHSFDSDRFLCKYDWDKRQEILGKEISFWKKVFDTYTPDCIVNEVVTIEWMEVMSIEANQKGIPYYRIALLPFDREDIWIHNNPFNSRLGKDFWDGIVPNEEDYKKANDYIALTRGDGRKPYFIKNNQQNYITRLLKNFHYFFDANIKRLLNKKFLYEDYSKLSKQALSASLCRMFHNKYDHFEPMDGVEYLFYPIHLEPEATIEYFSFFFNDQIMMIGRIAHSLKTNQKLIIKEHPQQRGLLMTKRFRELKKKYSNLVFLPSTVSTYDIYPHIRCLVTLSGTAGFESWICKRPVIVFGEVYYRDFPNIIKCDSYKQLYDIIRNDRYVIASDAEILQTVAKMYHAMEDVFPVILKGHDFEDDCKNVTKQIEKRLEN